ncbi:MAG: hypothetical protein EU543_05355 [Promethearchaeota archaeon]|nr:MAG: hypothetical protein EU543_05355 [Candidatus Lokiarchaeota archaeon]
MTEVGEYHITFSLTERKNYKIEDYLRMLNKVRELIKSCQELNLNEKAELCKLERCFMKSYLKTMKTQLS